VVCTTLRKSQREEGPLAKPKFFLDTSTCIDVGKGTIASSEWAWLFARATRKYQYCISPLTAYELIAGLATGADAHFDRNREAVRILHAQGRGSYLKPLRTFMARVLFGEPVETAAAPHIELWLEAVLRAKDRAALEGNVRVPYKGQWRTFGLKLSEINRQLRDIQAGYAKRFRQFRSETIADLTPEIWAKMVLDGLEQPVTDANRKIVLESCDAAFRFDRGFFDYCKDPKYDFSKHGAEIVDAQQLYYLCDATVLFVTEEKKIRKRVSDSPQAHRIMTADEFGRHATP
jgi:hypothetical protein